MNNCFYRFIFIVCMGANLAILPHHSFAQDVVQTEWDTFINRIDSFESKGKKDQALHLLQEREKRSLQLADWEDALRCINKYCRMIEVEAPGLKRKKILANRWIAAEIQTASPARASFTQQLGEVYMTELDQKDSAQIFHRQAREDFRLLEMWEDYAYATLLIGINFYYDGKYEQAEKWCLAALDSANTYLKIGNSAIPAILNVLGVIATTTGDFDRSLKYSQQTMQAYEQMGDMTVIDSQFLGTLYINRGHNLMEMEDYDQALAHFQKAQFLLNKLSQKDPADLTAAMINEGMTHWKLGDKEKAHQIWIQMIRQIEHQPGFEKNRLMSTVYNNLAEYYLGKKMYATAIAYLEKAAKLESIERAVATQTMLNMGKAKLEMGAFEQAKLWIEKAIKEIEGTQQESSILAADAYLELARYYEGKGEKEMALKQVQHAIFLISEAFENVSIQALPEIHQVSDRGFFLRMLQKKATLGEALYHEQQDDAWLKLSAQTYELAIHLIDSIRLTFRTEGAKLRFAEVAHQVYDGAIQLALIMYAQAPDPEILKKAFSYAEKNKGLTLREALQESDAKQFAGIPAQILARERKLKSELGFYRKKIFDEKQKEAADSLKIALWQNKQFELRRAFLGLLDTLEHTYRDYFELKYQDNSVSADGVMAALHSEQALVEYFWGAEEVVVFCLTKDTIQVFSQAITADLLDQLSSLREALSQKPGDEPKEWLEAFQQYTADAYGIYQQLLEPFLKYQDVDELLIIPDGSLGYIPFGVLLTDEIAKEKEPRYAHLPYLFKNRKISYEYAAAFLAHRYPEKGSGKGLLGFAPAYRQAARASGLNTTRSNWEPLVYNQDEVQRIAEQMKGKAFLGGAATKQRFLEEAPHYGILHLAMHGFINDRDPLYSGLVFSDKPYPNDSAARVFLHAYELYGLSLQAELAVLSACNTANGQFAEGEGIMSLARAFRYAGCPSILTSLWAADDRASIRMMEYFYKYVEKGMEKHQALQKARNAYLGSTRRDHPYYWAGFVLIGDQQAVSLHASSRKYVWGIGIGIVCLLLILWGVGKAVRKKRS